MIKPFVNKNKDQLFLMSHIIRGLTKLYLLRCACGARRPRQSSGNALVMLTEYLNILGLCSTKIFQTEQYVCCLDYRKP